MKAVTTANCPSVSWNFSVGTNTQIISPWVSSKHFHGCHTRDNEWEKYVHWIMHRKKKVCIKDLPKRWESERYRQCEPIHLNKESNSGLKGKASLYTSCPHLLGLSLYPSLASGLLIIPQIWQAVFCPNAFALAIFSACKYSPSDPCGSFLYLQIFAQNIPSQGTQLPSAVFPTPLRLVCFFPRMLMTSCTTELTYFKLFVSPLPEHRKNRNLYLFCSLI